MRLYADDTLKMPIAQSKLKNPYNNSAISFSPKEIVFNIVYSDLTCGNRVLNSRFLRSAMQWAAPSNFETFLEKLAFYFTTERVLTFNNLACLRQAGAEHVTVLPQDTLAPVYLVDVAESCLDKCNVCLFTQSG